MNKMDEALKKEEKDTSSETGKTYQKEALFRELTAFTYSLGGAQTPRKIPRVIRKNIKLQKVPSSFCGYHYSKEKSRVLYAHLLCPRESDNSHMNGHVCILDRKVRLTPSI
jgi:hypothetical protein